MQHKFHNRGMIIRRQRTRKFNQTTPAYHNRWCWLLGDIYNYLHNNLWAQAPRELDKLRTIGYFDPNSIALYNLYNTTLAPEGLFFFKGGGQP